MRPLTATPVVHLELHTGDRAGASAFHAEVCGWRPEWIQTRCGAYLTVELGRPGGGARMGGGIVERDTERALWLPYVEVPRIDEATERARRCGASVLLEPREGPAGWRSVIASAAGGEIAFWQQKR